jgi:hypothetical protein
LNKYEDIKFNIFIKLLEEQDQLINSERTENNLQKLTENARKKCILSSQIINFDKKIKNFRQINDSNYNYKY